MKLSTKRALFQFFTVLPVTLILSYYEIKPFSFFNKGINVMSILATAVLFFIATIIFQFLLSKNIIKNKNN